jgi:cephalosporin-C deacetylase
VHTILTRNDLPPEDTVCPPSTQFAAYDRMRCPKSLIVLPNYGHEGLPSIGDHAFAFLAGL